jgi:hypothetical protein
MPRKTLVFDVSSHGLGHLAQSGPVIGEICRRFRNVQIILRTRCPIDSFPDLAGADIQLSRPPPEAALVASSAMSFDAPASAQAYRVLHQNWSSTVAREAAILDEIRPDGVIANVNYVSLAAAQRACIPHLAFCCMNWLDIYSAYFAERPEAPDIISAMTSAYSDGAFFQPRPHMPMPGLQRRQSIGVIARRGENRSQELRRRLGLSQEKKIVLFTLGGLAIPADMTLPIMEEVHWISGRGAKDSRKDISLIGSNDFSFIDLLASVDAVVGKDSYGTVAETACGGIGLVMIPRADWPETPYLVDWAYDNCNFALAAAGADNRSALADALRHVLAAPLHPAIEPNGISELVDVITDQFGL